MWVGSGWDVQWVGPPMPQIAASWAILAHLSHRVSPDLFRGVIMTQVSPTAWAFWLSERDNPSYVSEFGVYWYGSEQHITPISRRTAILAGIGKPPTS